MLLLLHWHWDLPGTLDGYKEDVGAAFGDLEEHNCKHQPPTEIRVSVQDKRTSNSGSLHEKCKGKGP